MLECVYVFFVQAEDGIRDLVRSRGLGDVYKRQVVVVDDRPLAPSTNGAAGKLPVHDLGEWPALLSSVSYTHLTLPTSDLV